LSPTAAATWFIAKKIRPAGVGVTAERPPDEQKVEFLASTDNWFRPVQLANGPDGALYLCDMYREVIEHPWSLPDSLKKHLDLNSGNDRGRIYRVVPERFQQPRLPRLSQATINELVKTLEHPNGWHRDTAARLLYERQDPSAVPLLRRSLGRSKWPLADSTPCVLWTDWERWPSRRFDRGWKIRARSFARKRSNSRSASWRILPRHFGRNCPAPRCGLTRWCAISWPLAWGRLAWRKDSSSWSTSSE